MSYAEENKIAFENFSPQYQKEFLQGDLRNWSSLFHGSKLKCVSCGGRVNSMNCNYFKWEMDKVKCYACQNNKK